MTLRDEIAAKIRKYDPDGMDIASLFAKESADAILALLRSEGIVERVAAAIAHGTMQTTPYYIAWDRMDERGKKHYRTLARYALDAITGASDE